MINTNDNTEATSIYRNTLWGTNLGRLSGSVHFCDDT